MGVSRRCALVLCFLSPLGSHTVPQSVREERRTRNKLPSPQEVHKVIPHQPFPSTLGASKPRSQWPWWSRYASECSKVSSTQKPDLLWHKSRWPHALPCTHPPLGHSRALHSSDAIALPSPRWQLLGREEKGWLGEARSDPHAVPRSRQVGSSYTHVCARCVCAPALI